MLLGQVFGICVSALLWRKYMPINKLIGRESRVRFTEGTYKELRSKPYWDAYNSQQSAGNGVRAMICAAWSLQRNICGSINLPRRGVGGWVGGGDG